eukprot:GHRQ01035406.1.p1 GENE.GHRQ01035406.1~~GHRQ01035406.1.p1  ORF type:complete len:380 (+),score=80.90 GHRQ01035406.1:579-1718(+)
MLLLLQCDLPWSAPFLDSYKGGRGPTLNLTMCNWYLPQGPNVPALYRFLWQLQYLVSQGFYLLLDFSSTRESEVNMQNPAVLAQNWGNFWKILTDIPAYKDHLAGRIFPDLVNEPRYGGWVSAVSYVFFFASGVCAAEGSAQPLEPSLHQFSPCMLPAPHTISAFRLFLRLSMCVLRSRWGCQWQESCHEVNGTNACAPILQSYGLAAAAIWQSDPSVPIFINGLGQDPKSPKYDQCGNAYPGMHWGDGFITNRPAIQQYSLSDPSDIFTTAFTQKFGFLRVEHGDAQVRGALWLCHELSDECVTMQGGVGQWLAGGVCRRTLLCICVVCWKQHILVSFDHYSGGARPRQRQVVLCCGAAGAGKLSGGADTMFQGWQGC